MGLQVRVFLYASDEAQAFRAASAAFEEIARLDQIMSDYRRDSELMKLAASAGDGPRAVSEDLFVVLARAQRLAAQTDGAFDVTVSPLVRLWRDARRAGVMPDRKALKRARSAVGWRRLTLDPDTQTATLERRGMQLDLGGIAKGYAADRALTVLSGHGVSRALIEFGGDVRVGDPPPGREGWRVEVADADSAHRHMVIANAAIASSGDTEQFVEIDGIRYSHVVDPKTGLGLTTRIAATVIAPDGITADGLATALTLLDPQDGAALRERYYPEADVYLRYVVGNGETVYSTSWIR